MARSAYAGCDPWRPDRQGCPPQESQPLLSQNGAQPNTYDRKQMFPLVLPTCIYQASPWHQIIGATASEPLPVACNSMQVRTAGLRRTSGTTVWPSPVAAPGTHRESSSGSFEEVVCSLKLMFWCEAWEILADKRAVRPCLGLLGRMGCWGPAPWRRLRSSKAATAAAMASKTAAPTVGNKVAGWSVQSPSGVQGTTQGSCHDQQDCWSNCKQHGGRVSCAVMLAGLQRVGAPTALSQQTGSQPANAASVWQHGMALTFAVTAWRAAYNLQASSRRVQSLWSCLLGCSRPALLRRSESAVH